MKMRGQAPSPCTIQSLALLSIPTEPINRSAEASNNNGVSTIDVHGAGGSGKLVTGGEGGSFFFLFNESGVLGWLTLRANRHTQGRERSELPLEKTLPSPLKEISLRPTPRIEKQQIQTYFFISIHRKKGLKLLA